MIRWTLYLKGPKGGHAVVAMGHKVYYFGGYCDRESYNYGEIVVHIFNTVSLCWSKLPPVTNGTEEHPLEVPCIRCRHTAVLIENVIYIWGGITKKRECSDMLYGFHVDSHRWFKPTISGNVPLARINHSACALEKVMYIYGGYSHLTGRTNDIHKLDTTTMVWSLIKTRGTPSPASSCHSATMIETRMFVFGGLGDHYYHYNNISVFDTETNCWLSTPTAQLLPEGRAFHSAFAYNGELYIFGGVNLCLRREFNDLWKFNPDTFSWKKVEPEGKGPCLSMSNFRMCCCMVGDRIVLFRGYRYKSFPVDVGEYKRYTPADDLYVLDLSPSLKTLCKLAVIQYGLEQAGLPSDIRWELAAMTANSNRKNNMSLLRMRMLKIFRALTCTSQT